MPRARPTRLRRPAERAFTLIELLVVMIIISILMAVAIPTFLSQKSSARKTQLLTNITLMQKAVEACAANRTDGSYAGCVEHDQLFDYEKSLKDIPKCCPAGPRNTPGQYDLNAIGEGETIVWTPNTTDMYQGYEIDVWMPDGDKDVWFQLAHWEDGTVTKKCGAGRNPTFTKTPEPGVPGSRVCTNGRW